MVLEEELRDLLAKWWKDDNLSSHTKRLIVCFTVHGKQKITTKISTSSSVDPWIKDGDKNSKSR